MLRYSQVIKKSNLSPITSAVERWAERSLETHSVFEFLMGRVAELDVRISERKRKSEFPFEAHAWRLIPEWTTAIPLVMRR